MMYLLNVLKVGLIIEIVRGKASMFRCQMGVYVTCASKTLGEKYCKLSITCLSVIEISFWYRSIVNTQSSVNL
jgi:hypothetical protein